MVTIKWETVYANCVCDRIDIHLDGGEEKRQDQMAVLTFCMKDEWAAGMHSEQPPMIIQREADSKCPANQFSVNPVGDN